MCALGAVPVHSQALFNNLFVCVRNFYFHHIFNHFIADHSIEYIVKSSFVLFFCADGGFRLCAAGISYAFSFYPVPFFQSFISVCVSKEDEVASCVNVANRFTAA